MFFFVVSPASSVEIVTRKHIPSKPLFLHHKKILDLDNNHGSSITSSSRSLRLRNQSSACFVLDAPGGPTTRQFAYTA